MDREDHFRLKKVRENKKKIEEVEQGEADERARILKEKGIKVEKGAASMIEEDSKNEDELDF